MPSRDVFGYGCYCHSSMHDKRHCLWTGNVINLLVILFSLRTRTLHHIHDSPSHIFLELQRHQDLDPGHFNDCSLRVWLSEAATSFQEHFLPPLLRSVRAGKSSGNEVKICRCVGCENKHDELLQCGNFITMPFPLYSFGMRNTETIGRGGKLLHLGITLKVF